jgi:hypothetical protein
VVTLVTKDHVRIGDMAAGTLLAYERTDIVLPGPPASQARDRNLSAADVEIASDLLLRWSTLEPAARHRLARIIISRYRGGTLPGEESDSDSALRAQLEMLAQGRTT